MIKKELRDFIFSSQENIETVEIDPLLAEAEQYYQAQVTPAHDLTSEISSLLTKVQSNSAKIGDIITLNERYTHFLDKVIINPSMDSSARQAEIREQLEHVSLNKKIETVKDIFEQTFTTKPTVNYSTRRAREHNDDGRFQMKYSSQYIVTPKEIRALSHYYGFTLSTDTSMINNYSKIGREVLGSTGEYVKTIADNGIRAMRKNQAIVQSHLGINMKRPAIHLPF